MFVKIIFHGVLKRICPDIYEVEANTPAEAIRGLTNQFRDKLIRKDGYRFVCSIKECPNMIQITSGIRTEELNIYPAFCASGGGNSFNWKMIAIGAVIIGAAVVLGPGAAFLTAGAWGTWSTSFAMMGASFMLTGISNMLFGTNVDTSRGDTSNPESSRVFGNNGNTTKIGTRIPIGYGVYKLAGQYLSVNTQAIDRNSSLSSN